MKREWKPGDVLTGHINSSFRGREVFFVVEVTANSRAAWGPGLHAINADGNGVAVANILDPCPVAVIDPESDADVARLENALEAKGCRVWAGVRAALREFANPTPPKPEEPTGLGAVVEDAEGNRFIRYGSDLAPWIGAPTNAGLDPDRPYRYWARISAVRVLSEGEIGRAHV